MSRESRHVWWPAAGLTLGLFLLTLAVLAGWTQAPDSSVSVWFASHRPQAVVAGADLLGVITTPALVASVGLGASFFILRSDPRPWRLAVGAAFVSGWLLKILVDRPRRLPPVNLSPESEASSPSGHVLILAVVLGCLRLMAGRLAVTAVVLVGLTSVQRLVVGAHWLSDVVAAWLLAAVVLAVFSVVLRRGRVADRTLTSDPPSRILGRC